MRNIILALDIICIIPAIIITVNIITYLKKSENIEVEIIKKSLNNKIRWLQFLTIMIIIFSVSINIDNILKGINEDKLDKSSQNDNSNIIIEEESIDMIKLKVNDSILDIALENNSSAKAFLEKLKVNDIVVEAHDYGNFEKVGSLGFSLPTNDTYITTQAGDLILYQGNQITLYYDTNTWNFTLLGKVQGVTQEELKNILGRSSVRLVFSLKN